MAGPSEAQLAQQIEQQIMKATEMVEAQIDAQMQKLEDLDEDDLEAIRRRRLEEMKKARKQQDDWRAAGHGSYVEITNEKEFFDESKKHQRMVVHFYRDSTFRCKIVDKHLALLAPKHIETYFLKLCVDRAPFLCERLKIHVLPTIMMVIDNQTKSRIAGFDELGGTDEFSTEMLEWRLGVAGGIEYHGDLSKPPTAGGSSSKPSIFGFAKKNGKSKTIQNGLTTNESDDDEFDEDDWN